MTTDLRAAIEALRKPLSDRYDDLQGVKLALADLDEAASALLDAAPAPELDPRVAEAFDLLGGMWSWSEANGYFATGNSWPLQAGRLLREVVGRPAQPPAALAASFRR